MSKANAFSALRQLALAVAITPALCFSGCASRMDQPVSATSTANEQETIVLIRHGEIAAGGLGQLSCRGFNRSVLLPADLIDRFGQANAIFAPDPADEIREGKPTQRKYSYVRALATIEPTAIRLDLPVNAELAYSDLDDLESEVTAPTYSTSTIFIAWEHENAYAFAKRLLSAYGLDPSQVPAWPENNFDMIYVFRITPASRSGTGKAAMTFEVQKEGLDALLPRACV